MHCIIYKVDSTLYTEQGIIYTVKNLKAMYFDNTRVPVKNILVHNNLKRGIMNVNNGKIDIFKRTYILMHFLLKLKVSWTSLTS